MTVPPNQPQRPSDHQPPPNEAPPDATPHDTSPASEATSKLDQTIATDQALAGLPQEHTHHTDPAPDAPATPPAKTYLSGIVTAGLAAICGAVFTSWAGVQGTLVGAMIGATIGSSVSELVRAPLDSLERRLIAAGVSARRLRRDGVVKTVVTSPTAAQQALGMIPRGAVVAVGATAIVGFLLAVGGVTAVEVAAGEPLAAIISDDPSTGTTIGNALPNPPQALAPDPAAPASGQSAGGVTSSKPADPILGSEDPNVAGSPSPEANGTAANEAQNTNSAASPEALASADTTATATPTVSSTPTTEGSTTATAGTVVVEIVTVVVTATPTSSPTRTTPGAGATTAGSAATPTPSRTPTLTPTSTPTSTAVSAPTTSPPAPSR